MNIDLTVTIRKYSKSLSDPLKIRIISNVKVFIFIILLPADALLTVFFLIDFVTIFAWSVHNSASSAVTQPDGCHHEEAPELLLALEEREPLAEGTLHLLQLIIEEKKKGVAQKCSRFDPSTTTPPD